MTEGRARERARERVALERTLDRIAARFSGVLGYAVMNVATGETFEREADTLLPTASAIKAPILAELYRQVAAGTVALSTRVPVRAEEIIAGSGVVRRLAPGLAPTVEDLAVLMIIVSDNTATNLLIDLLGGPVPINETVQGRLGLRDTVLHNRIDFTAIGDDVRRFAESTPRDLMTYMAMLARGEVVSPEASAAIIAILRQQMHLDRFPRYLAINPYPAPDEPVRIWAGGKTGSFAGDRVDCGLVGLPDGTLIAHAVMTEGGRDRGYGPENEAAVAIGLIGRAVVDYWWPAAAGPAPLLDSPYLAAWLADPG